MISNLLIELDSALRAVTSPISLNNLLHDETAADLSQLGPTDFPRTILEVKDLSQVESTTLSTVLDVELTLTTHQKKNPDGTLNTATAKWDAAHSHAKGINAFLRTSALNVEIRAEPTWDTTAHTELLTTSTTFSLRYEITTP